MLRPAARKIRAPLANARAAVAESACDIGVNQFPMKMLHTLKARWLVLAMILTTVLGETIAWQISRTFGVRFDPVAVGAVCVGATAAIVAWIYDGRD